MYVLRLHIGGKISGEVKGAMCWNWSLTLLDLKQVGGII